jgi:recombinational DNA repair protein (RecF pathway)
VRRFIRFQQFAHRASKTSRKISAQTKTFSPLDWIFGAPVDKLFTGETVENAKLLAKLNAYSLNQGVD